MRIRIGIFLAYLLLGCILLEDALPYFAEMNTMEMYEAKTETGEKDGKKEKKIEKEWKVLKEKLQLGNFYDGSFLTHPGSLHADSDAIPDSEHQSIFSPPPDRA